MALMVDGWRERGGGVEGGWGVECWFCGLLLLRRTEDGERRCCWLAISVNAWDEHA